MAGSGPRQRDVEPQESPARPPVPYAGHSDHSFTLQAVMEMQKSIGAMECSVGHLSSKLDSQKQTMDDMRKVVGSIEKVIYAAGVILLIALALGGWMLSTAKDFAMTYYKASIEAQAKPQATAAPTPVAKPIK